MKKMLLSIIIPILLLAILFFIFPDSHYLDYYLHYINTANDPLFDWFVIMMGGISVNDISMMLIATLLIIYSFALFEKDEDRNTNVKLKHVVYGILGTAIIMRIIYLCLFAINISTCDEYKTINTQITDISDNKITVIVDSIPLSKSINSDDAKQAFIGDKIVINVGKGSLGYYCLGDEYKIIKSATKTTENIVDKTKEPVNEAKPVNDTKTAEKATPVVETKTENQAKSAKVQNKIDKTVEKKEKTTADIKTENKPVEEDWEERNERNIVIIPFLLCLASLAFIALVYYLFYKLFEIKLSYRTVLELLFALFLIFIFYNRSSTDELKLGKGVIYNKRIERDSYLIYANYKGKDIIRNIPKNVFEKVNIGDTLIFQIFNGKLGLNNYCNHDSIWIKKGNEIYVPHIKGTSSNLIPMDKVPEQDINHRNYNIMDSIRKHLIEDIEEITKPDRKSYSLVLSFIVEGDSSKLIKDISIHKYPNDKIKRKVVDLIDQSEELRRLGNGIYLLNVHVYGGYIDEFKIKHIKTKEDYEILIAYYLHNKFPTLGNLRGSVFIDVTVSEDGNNEVKVSQSLHPKIDKMALDLAKNIPWHLSDVKSKRKGTKYRLTIMYAKGKLWQVKMWNMD